MDISLPKDRKISSTQNIHTKALLEDILKTLEEGKAEDIITIDLDGKADFAHFMVIASGRSSRHIASLSDDVKSAALDSGVNDVSVEGANVGEWVLIDAFDVVVHIFKPEARENYDLEKMWGFEVD